MWTKGRVNFEHWEAEVTFRVSGRGRMGADGLVMRGHTLVWVNEAMREPSFIFRECVTAYNLLMYFKCFPYIQFIYGSTPRIDFLFSELFTPLSPTLSLSDILPN